MAGVSEYKINGKVMLYADYDKRLQEFNILVKARNFLVFQVRIISLSLVNDVMP